MDALLLWRIEWEPEPRLVDVHTKSRHWGVSQDLIQIQLFDAPFGEYWGFCEGSLWSFGTIRPNCFAIGQKVPVNGHQAMAILNPSTREEVLSELLWL